MHRIVKVNMYVAGQRWGIGGKVVIPDEAIEDFNLMVSDKVLLMPGSKRSGVLTGALASDDHFG